MTYRCSDFGGSEFFSCGVLENTMPEIKRAEVLE